MATVVTNIEKLELESPNSEKSRSRFNKVDGEMLLESDSALNVIFRRTPQTWPLHPASNAPDLPSALPQKRPSPTRFSRSHLSPVHFLFV